MNGNIPFTQAHDAVVKALNAGVSPGGLPAVQLLQHGTMKLYFYELRGEDKQPAHAQPY